MQELSQMGYQYHMVYPREVYWDHFFLYVLLMIYIITYQNVKLASKQMTQLLYVLDKTAEEVQISLKHNLNCVLEWFKANHLLFKCQENQVEFNWHISETKERQQKLV